MAFERQLYAGGQRGAMQEPSGRPRSPSAPLALPGLLHSLGADAVACVPHNAGNAAFAALLALQLLLAPETRVPAPKPSKRSQAQMMQAGMHMARAPSVPPALAFMPPPMAPVFPVMGMGGAPFPGRLTPEGYAEQMNGGGGRVSSYFPSHRPSSADHRLSAPPAHTFNGRTPGRARVSSMNDLANMGNGSFTAVDELGQQMSSLHVKARTIDSRGMPQSR